MVKQPKKQTQKKKKKNQYQVEKMFTLILPMQI